MMKIIFKKSYMPYIDILYMCIGIFCFLFYICYKIIIS